MVILKINSATSLLHEELKSEVLLTNKENESKLFSMISVDQNDLHRQNGSQMNSTLINEESINKNDEHQNFEDDSWSPLFNNNNNYNYNNNSKNNNERSNHRRGGREREEDKQPFSTILNASGGALGGHNEQDEAKTHFEHEKIKPLFVNTNLTPSSSTNGPVTLGSSINGNGQNDGSSNQSESKKNSLPVDSN